MEENSYVDIDASISQGNVVLTLKKSCFYYVDLISTIFFLMVFSFAQFMAGLECFKYPDTPDRIFASILFIVATIALFGIYRKIIEHKLLIINHNLTRNKVKKVVLEYFKDIPEKNIIKNGDCIVIKQEFSYFYKLHTFIIADTQLYFNVVNFYPKVNPPVIFDHIFIKKDLQKLLDKSIAPTPTPNSGLA